MAYARMKLDKNGKVVKKWVLKRGKMVEVLPIRLVFSNGKRVSQ